MVKKSEVSAPEIEELLRERLGSKKVNDSSTYTTLGRLVNAGLVASVTRLNKETNRMSMYYSVTEKGVSECTAWVNRIRPILAMVSNEQNKE